jgi:hypothetical protein
MSNKTLPLTAPIDSFTQQRGGKDCVIAATATAANREYEEIACALCIPIEDNGQPDANILADGIEIVDLIPPLLGLGFLGTLLMAREHPLIAGSPRQPKLLTSDQIKSAIAGRKAIIGYSDDDPGVGEHALAWDGTKAIDCSNGVIVDLATITIHVALIMTVDANRTGNPT